MIITLLPPNIRLSRNRVILIKEMDDICYLVDPKSNAIFHLNQLGKGIWSLLQQSVTLHEILETLYLAFPEENSKRIEKDIKNLINEMLAKKLVVTINQ